MYKTEPKKGTWCVSSAHNSYIVRESTEGCMETKNLFVPRMHIKTKHHIFHLQKDNAKQTSFTMLLALIPPLDLLC